jgi:hypothetical protein
MCEWFLQTDPGQQRERMGKNGISKNAGKLQGPRQNFLPDFPMKSTHLALVVAGKSGTHILWNDGK